MLKHFWISLQILGDIRMKSSIFFLHRVKKCRFRYLLFKTCSWKSIFLSMNNLFKRLQRTCQKILSIKVDHEFFLTLKIARNIFKALKSSKKMCFAFGYKWVWSINKTVPKIPECMHGIFKRWPCGVNISPKSSQKSRDTILLMAIVCRAGLKTIFLNYDMRHLDNVLTVKSSKIQKNVWCQNEVFTPNLAVKGQAKMCRVCSATVFKNRWPAAVNLDLVQNSGGFGSEPQPQAP